MDKEIITKMVASYIGLIGLYLKNPNFNRLVKDLRKYRNTPKNINPDSVDVFKYINDVANNKMLSFKHIKMMLDTLELFRNSDIDNDKLKKYLIESIKAISYKLKRFLDASLIMIINDLDENNITEKVKLIYSYLKRKKYECEFIRYYKMSRGK